MPVRDSDAPVTVTFRLGDQTFAATLRRGQIVHEAFHAALPTELTHGHRLTFRTPPGDEIFADNFLGDIVDRDGEATLITSAVPLAGRAGLWRNVGFDHLAITVADRAAARDFFVEVLQLLVMRDDEHLTVLATGPTALFLFDAGQEAPLSTGQPSTWHHLGFVVDDLEAAYAHLEFHRDRLLSDFTLLERDERWSLYFFYRNGEVTFMIQLSQIKAAERGITDPARADFPTLLYDYASRPYGEQFGAAHDTTNHGAWRSGGR
jgi:catechol 2,3-dioxygenase-like lactoylglutathione lyase family enzyme